MTLGEKIRKLRKERKRSIVSCAEEIYVHTSTWCNWEKDKQTPTVHYVCDIADVFSVMVDELLKDEKGNWMI